MKIAKKIIGRGIVGVFCILILILIFITIYHYIMLNKESKLVKPNGTLVNVDGYDFHVYAEGANEDKPTLVFMSGSGIAAPVYDYKVLYSKLSDEYRIVVIEKFGYGYSDISGLPRDVETMVEQNRKALSLAGEKGPYILIPHSMSGLEAIYWSHNYPDEVASIIGLDMAVPESYAPFTNDFLGAKILSVITKTGIHRLPFINPVSERELSSDEIKQHKYLVYKNTLNREIVLEGKFVNENAKLVGQLGTPDIPMLLFVSNGSGLGENNWINIQKNFASKSDHIQLINLDCGHNIHYYESEYIAKMIKDFL